MRKLLALTLVVFSLTQAQYLDVPPNHWAAEAVQELTELGVLTGYPDQTFRGNRNITRYEAAVALWRLLKVLSQNPRYATTDAVEALAEAVQQLSLSLSALEERLRALETAASTPGIDPEALVEIQDALARLQSEVRNLKHSPEPTTPAQAPLPAKLGEELQALKEQVGVLWAAVDALNAYIAGEADDRTRLRSELATIRKRLEELTARLAALDRIEDLASKVETLEGKLKGLSKDVNLQLAKRAKELEAKLRNQPWPKLTGSVEAKAGQATVVIDLDRLFPGAFSQDATSSPAATEPQDLYYNATASVALKAKNASVTAAFSVLEQSAYLDTLNVQIENTRLHLSQDLRFRLSPYLLANQSGTLQIQGGLVEVKSGAQSFLGVLGKASRGDFDPDPAFEGYFYGAAWGAGPVRFFLGGVHGERFGVGTELRTSLAGWSLEGVWTTTSAVDKPVGSWLDPATSDWAYHVRVERAGFSAAYFAVDPDYGDGGAGLSGDAASTEPAGYPAGERGLELSAEHSFGVIRLASYARAWEDYLTGASRQTYTLATAYQDASWRAQILWSRAHEGGQGIFSLGPAVDALEGYAYADPLQRRASVWAGFLEWNQEGREAFLGLRRFESGHLDTEVALKLDSLVDQGGLRFSVGGRWHRFGGSAGAPTYNTLKAWGSGGLDAGVVFARATAAWRGTRYTAPGVAYSEELLFRVEGGIRDLLLPGSELRAGWARYRASGIAGTDPSVAGDANVVENPREDGLFYTLAEPWAFTSGTATADLNGLYLGFSVGGLDATAGTFWGSQTATAFRIHFKAAY